jgi:hypothetical protein
VVTAWHATTVAPAPLRFLDLVVFEGGRAGFEIIESDEDDARLRVRTFFEPRLKRLRGRLWSVRP